MKNGKNTRTAWHRELADRLIVERSNAKSRYDAARTAYLGAEKTLGDAEEAVQIVQAVAEQIQEVAHNKIAGVVTKCLATVFEDPYEFAIEFKQARNRTEAHLRFIRDGHTVPPMGSSGGGVIDVAAFALRLSCLMLSRPASRRVVVLDEPFKFVSADRRFAVRQMLEDLSTELKVQFIIVTHIEELRCGTIVEISK